jgi:hypothetical protein
MKGSDKPFNKVLLNHCIWVTIVMIPRTELLNKVCTLFAHFLQIVCTFHR